MQPQMKDVSVCVMVVEFRITEKTEQRLCIKFCQNLENTCNEIYDITKKAYGEDSMSPAQGF